MKTRFRRDEPPVRQRLGHSVPVELCPHCRFHPVVSNIYWTEGKGYLIVRECAGTLDDPATCTYRRVL